MKVFFYFTVGQDWSGMKEGFRLYCYFVIVKGLILKMKISKNITIKHLKDIRWTDYLNYITIIPLLSAVAGNYSLGSVVVGLTALIWGLESGAFFISLTTVVLVFLTGNINMEIIFLYSLTMAYLIRDERIMKRFSKETVYIAVFLISLFTFPLWRYILGVIPVELLNNINIAGEVMLAAGLILFLIRGKILLENGISSKAIFRYILYFICSVFALLGSYLIIPVWLLGVYIVNRYSIYISRTKLQRNRGTILFAGFLLILTASAAKILLPISFLAGLIILASFFIVFRKIREIPLMEMVYLSIILGITAGKMGLLL